MNECINSLKMKTQNFVYSNGLDTVGYTYWHLNVNTSLSGTLLCPCMKSAP